MKGTSAVKELSGSGFLSSNKKYQNQVADYNAKNQVTWKIWLFIFSGFVTRLIGIYIGI